MEGNLRGLVLVNAPIFCLQFELPFFFYYLIELQMGFYPVAVALQ
jgi:hypothetical protein